MRRNAKMEIFILVVATAIITLSEASISPETEAEIIEFSRQRRAIRNDAGAEQDLVTSPSDERGSYFKRSFPNSATYNKGSGTYANLNGMPGNNAHQSSLFEQHNSFNSDGDSNAIDDDGEGGMDEYFSSTQNFPYSQKTLLGGPGQEDDSSFIGRGIAPPGYTLSNLLKPNPFINGHGESSGNPFLGDDEDGSSGDDLIFYPTQSPIQDTDGDDGDDYTPGSLGGEGGQNQLFYEYSGDNTFDGDNDGGYEGGTQASLQYNIENPDDDVGGGGGGGDSHNSLGGHNNANNLFNSEGEEGGFDYGDY